MPFIAKRYFGLSVDPIHIGTGGYRLGRVDNTIVREPGTSIPKIPGSSISGVCRSFTAIHPEVNKYPDCAGKGREDNRNHCGQNKCPVCVAFGFSIGESNKSFQGLAQLSDARILFFPVYSMLGPVWITSPSILKEHSIDANLSDWKTYKNLGTTAIPEGGRLNFGWLMLDKDADNGPISLENRFNHINQEVKTRLFLVSERMFSRIVNDNLEVRTSVAIDPETGAAVPKALFTYEAIPRTTIFWFDITYSNPQYFRIDNSFIMLPPRTNIQDPFSRENIPLDNLSYLAYYVEQGLSYFKTLGLGGMNTRGFGRIDITNGEVLHA